MALPILPNPDKHQRIFTDKDLSNVKRKGIRASDSRWSWLGKSIKYTGEDNKKHYLNRTSAEKFLSRHDIKEAKKLSNKQILIKIEELGTNHSYASSPLPDRSKIETNQQNLKEELLKPPKIEETKELTKIQPKPFFKKLEIENPEYKKLANEVLSSTAYTEEEKSDFLFHAEDIYGEYIPGENSRKLIEKQDWVEASVTFNALKYLEFIYPHFKVNNDENSYYQYDAEQFNEKTITDLLNLLPEKLPDQPFIYGYSLVVDGNHRTAFIIDLETHSVEYFNSFGDDNRAEKPLQELSNALSNKYGKEFNYLHQTSRKTFQTDTYQCGVWACKLIEDRVRMKSKFTTDGYEKFDIAAYRRQMYARALEHQFYRNIGENKLRKYMNKIPSMDELRQCLLIEGHFPEWCRTGIMPQAVKEHVDKVLGINNQ